MKPLAATDSDGIATAIRALNVQSTVFCLSELRAPWGFRVAGSALAKFHLVLSGSGWLRLDGEPPLEVADGDLVILPRGQAHSIADTQGSRLTALEDLIARFPLDDHLRLCNNGSGPQTRILCGGFALSSSSAHLVGTLLPDVVHLKTAGVAATAWLEQVLLALDAEAGSQQPGTTVIKEKIADVFVAQALRAWMVGAGSAGWKSPVHGADPPIAKALDALRNHLSETWTLDRLAAHVGLSRTALTTRFREAVGQPPMRYLTKLRLATAAGFLATDDRTVYEIAFLTGYDSDASLSKAFRREFGVPPGAYRQRSRERPAILAE